MFRFCFEGMEESGSEGLDEMLMARANTKFLKEVCQLSKKVLKRVSNNLKGNNPSFYCKRTKVIQQGYL